jgi:hypothetical protein
VEGSMAKYEGHGIDEYAEAYLEERGLKYEKVY